MPCKTFNRVLVFFLHSYFFLIGLCSEHKLRVSTLYVKYMWISISIYKVYDLLYMQITLSITNKYNIRWYIFYQTSILFHVASFGFHRIIYLLDTYSIIYRSVTKSSNSHVKNTQLKVFLVLEDNMIVILWCISI